MPFAVFRRHQKKLLAIFAILAMFGFVVADSLPRLLSGGSNAGGNPTVAVIYGKRIRRSDIKEMADQRNTANMFMLELTGALFRQPAPQFFGDLNTKSLVDALILEHEADRLGMPNGPKVARDWLKKNIGTAMTGEFFDQLLARFNKQVSGDQLLAAIANQLRISKVRTLIGPPTITPFDVYETYRAQNERVSARAVGFPVEDYVAKVPEPTASELQAFYEKYKNVLPDPNRPTPGFKIPHQIQVEILSIDGEALLRSFQDKLTEAELLSYYENRKAEFRKPSEFPDEIFQDDAKLTPPQITPFSEIRANLAVSLAEEKAQTEIINKFGRIKDEVMIPFADKYLEAAEEIAEAAKAKRKASVSLPKLETLEEAAKKEGLSYELSPLLTRDRAEHYGLISMARVGLSRDSGGRTFVEELFDTKSTLFEPIELTDDSGRRYLVRKAQDLPPRVPGLDEIRPQVVLAWKTQQARPLAEKAAKALAEKAKAAGGKIEGEVVDGHVVITTDPVTRLRPGFQIPGQFFETGPATPSEIPQIPSTGEPLRDAYFGLSLGDVAVAPNQPETIYYVLTLHQRFPASFSVLYAPSGDYFRYLRETKMEASKKREQEWLNELRAQAGLAPDWTPLDETKDKDQDESVGG